MSPRCGLKVPCRHLGLTRVFVGLSIGNLRVEALRQTGHLSPLASCTYTADGRLAPLALWTAPSSCRSYSSLLYLDVSTQRLCVNPVCIYIYIYVYTYSIYTYIYIYIYIGFTPRPAPLAQPRNARRPSNLPRGFQRFGSENHFGAGVFSDLGQGLGYLGFKSSPEVNPIPPLWSYSGFDGPRPLSGARRAQRTWTDGRIHILVVVRALVMSVGTDARGGREILQRTICGPALLQRVAGAGRAGGRTHTQRIAILCLGFDSSRCPSLSVGDSLLLSTG